MLISYITVICGTANHTKLAIAGNFTCVASIAYLLIFVLIAVRVLTETQGLTGYRILEVYSFPLGSPANWCHPECSSWGAGS